MDIINRLKSPIYLTSLFTNIFYVLKTFGLLEQYGISEEEYQGLVTLATVIVNIIAGANNPLDKEKF